MLDGTLAGKHLVQRRLARTKFPQAIPLNYHRSTYRCIMLSFFDYCSGGTGDADL